MRCCLGYEVWKCESRLVLYAFSLGLDTLGPSAALCVRLVLTCRKKTARYAAIALMVSALNHVALTHADCVHGLPSRTVGSVYQ